MNLRQALGAIGLVGALIACSSTTPSSGGAAPANDQVTSRAVGPAGGSVTVGDLTVSIPQSALAAETTITVTSTAGPGPAGASRFSKVFTFEPAGLTFRAPATVSFGFAGDAAKAAVFWSSSDGATWEKLETRVVSARATATITHFSSGFVGDGGVAFAGLKSGGGATCGASFTEGCFACYQRACPGEFAKCFGDKPAPGAIVGVCKTYGECICGCTSAEDCKKCTFDASCSACNESSGLFTCATKACAAACGG